jgi:protein translocase SecG subunit
MLDEPDAQDVLRLQQRPPGRCFFFTLLRRFFIVLNYVPMTLAGILPYIQIVLAVLLIVSILLQQTGASVGGAFGGDNFSAAYHTRRGSELFLFWATIVIAVLFAVTALVALIL